MQRNTNLEKDTTKKWKKNSDFNVPYYFSPSPDARDARGYKVLRQGIYTNNLAKVRHDIYIYAYDRFKGLEITYFICNRKLAEKFELTCKRVGLNIKINNDFFTQVYTFGSNDKVLLTAFINAIDEVDPLLEIKNELIETVNSHFIFTVEDLVNFADQLRKSEKEDTFTKDEKTKLTIFQSRMRKNF